MIYLTLPYPPTTNNLYVTRGKFRVPSTQLKNYKKAVQDICFVNRTKPIDGEIEVTIRVFRPRKSGDLDNTLKAVFDGLKGSAFHDDKQIVVINAYRYDDKANPRAEVEVQSLSEKHSSFSYNPQSKICPQTQGTNNLRLTQRERCFCKCHEPLEARNAEIVDVLAEHGVVTA